MINLFTAMKTLRIIPALSAVLAGIAAMVAGCTATVNPGQDGPQAEADLVRFSSSGSEKTKTSYSGYVDESYSERIDWVEGDKVLIWSDNADDHTANQINYGTYVAGAPTSNGLKSTASLTFSEGGQLKWGTAENYQFWAVYGDASLTMDGSRANVATPSFTGTIPAAQTLTAHTYEDESVKLEPSMANAYMTGYLSTPRVESAKIPFKAAFTAFEFTVRSEVETTLSSFTLKSTTDILGGPFLGSCTDGEWSYAAVEDDASSLSVSFDFPENTVIDADTPVVFTVFALPHDLTNLKAVFTFSDGTKKTLNLKENGSFKTFGGCLKHRISAVSIPAGWDYKIEANMEVIDWTDVAISEEFSNHAQASQFKITDGTATIDDSDHANRMAVYKANPGYIEVTFTVTAPQGGTWSVTKAGDDPDAFLVNSYDEDNGYGPATGLIEGETGVTIRIRPNTTDRSRTYKMQLRTSAEDAQGKYFSLDSETQLIDVSGYDYWTFVISE